MRTEWWWSAHGILIRKFQDKEAAQTSLDAETDPVLFITGEGWSFEVKKSEITIVSHEARFKI